MNVDLILDTFNQNGGRFILIGGMNFLMRHKPIITYDVDLWIEDEADNLKRCHIALSQLGAEWGASDDDWGPIAEKDPSWLSQQGVYCLTSPNGAIDIFRFVQGLDDWSRSFAAALQEHSAGGTEYRGLSDTDMLRCQEALLESARKQERIDILKAAIAEAESNDD